MIDKLEAIQARFEQVGIALTNPEIIGNQIVPSPTTQFVIKRTDIFPYVFVKLLFS